MQSNTPSSKLQVNIEVNSPPVIRAKGVLDYDSCDSLSKLISAAMADSGPTVELALAGLSFVDSSGLKTLVMAAREAKKNGGSLVVRSLTSQLSRLLDFSGSRDLFDIGAEPEGDVAVPVVESPLAISRCFTLPSGAVACCDARNKVCEFAVNLGCGPVALDDIKLAFGEAISNAVRHGAKAGDAIEIRCSGNDGRLVMTLKYPSAEFDPDAVPVPDLNLSPEGGMGIHFMKLVMDAVNYVFADGHATVTLERQLTD